MSDTNIELEKPNAVGVLDRLTTNVRLSVIAVFPTYWACIAAPWKLAPLLERDDPDGREGLLLAPGAFLPLALLVSLMGSALVATPEIVNSNGAYIGPGLAKAIQAALNEGDVWKVIATIMPIYGFAVLIGALGAALRPLAGEGWTLRVSLRAVFYGIAAAVSWIVISTAAIDLIRVSTGNNDFAIPLSMVVAVTVIALMFWMYFWFFRRVGSLSRVRSGALSIAMCALKIAALAAM